MAADALELQHHLERHRDIVGLQFARRRTSNRAAVDLPTVALAVVVVLLIAACVVRWVWH